jgi:predicted hydrocarbon binding protein
MSEEPFLEWLKLGKIRIEKGLIIFLDAHNILLPVRTLLKLQQLLKEKIGEEKAVEFLKELGSFQIKQALIRYAKLLGIRTIEKYKFEQLGKHILMILGYGNYEIKVRYEDKRMILQSNNAPIAHEFNLMFGKSEKPIDFYLCGMFQEVGSCIFGAPMECVETKCIACGDPYCQFEVFPAEEKKETKT